ncbi:MAG TPA: biotin carboxylase N-terminal domain-containing protein [Chloroflexia bacterium]|nr:biotin carboxylase N-terminal domain-containing protein [Chloroflexia bacterium]
MQIKKLLIANRGEIAVRIMRTCRRLGIGSVAIYSDADAAALHVREADEAYRVGPPPAAESYLLIPAILDAARRAGADAIHPGYGFLSERAPFAAAVGAAGLIWVGPSPEAIRTLGDKIAAKRIMDAAGVPTVPGYYSAERGPQDLVRLQAEAERIGYPVLIKAAAGGGGKGMRVVTASAEFGPAAEGAAREAAAAFGDATVFLEKYLRDPRHVEFQILGDAAGYVVHLGERECSIQRRHQKVLEEAPSPAPQLDAARRAAMGRAAVLAGQAAGYTNAGTVEFILDAAGHYYFLEMNTRLQVEHPVTEAITWVPMQPGGPAQPLDLVELQLRVAAGEPLPFAQDAVERRGHAVEVRVYAEDPATGFLPSIGRVRTFRPPSLPWVRNDSGVAAGDAVSIYYDPMLAKLIVAGPDRATAVERLALACAAYAVTGVTTNLGFLHWLAGHPAFVAGETDTGFLGRYFDPAMPGPVPPPEALIAAGAHDLLQALAGESPLAGAPARPAGRPYNPWTAGPWRLAGQDLDFRYGYLTPTGASLGRPDGVLMVHFSRGAAPGTWQATAPGTSALLAIEHGGSSGVRLRRLDGPAAADWQVQVLAPAPDRLVVSWGGAVYGFLRVPALDTDTMVVAAHAGEDKLEAPMPGKIIQVLVAAGDPVTAGQRLVVMEAMKMEFTIKAPHDGQVARLPVRVGQLVEAGAVLAEVTA